MWIHIFVNTKGKMHTGLDIDLLHTNVEKYNNGTLVGRNVGKTRTIIQLLVGSAEACLPQSTFVVVTHTWDWARSLWSAVHRELETVGVESVSTSRSDILLKDTGVHILFIPYEDVLEHHRLYGIRIFNYFLDDEEKIAQELGDRIQELKYLLELQITPTITRGY